jgi:uncharacterized protein (DUF1800 family)
MAEGRPGPRQYRPSDLDAPRSFPAHDYGEYAAPAYSAQYDEPQYESFEQQTPDPAPRHATDVVASRVLTRRNALLGTAVLGAGAGTTYLMRNVGKHGAAAPLADVPGVSLPVEPGEMPATLPRRLPGTGQPPKKPAAPKTSTGAGAPSLSSDAHDPAGSSGPGGAGTSMLNVKLDPEMLLRRATYGPTAAMRSFVGAHGVSAWLNAQLSPKAADAGAATVTKLFPRLSWSIDQVHRAYADNDQWRVMYDVVAAHIGRAAWGDRQLFEVMVDLWSNHLNITCPSGDVWDNRHHYDANVIRGHALDSFANMLLASAFHPAMLRYLNNAESTRRSPNENYARELMELHTVGVKGGYTETDVKHAALLLTGWKVEDGKAVYDADRHYVGPIKVMTFSHPNGPGAGQAAQRAFVTWLAMRPATATRIAGKLAIRFAGDTPPLSLVNKMAATYLANKTAIVPMLRTLFTSPEFAASAGAKVRRPFEQMVASLRAVGARPGTDPEGLMQLYWMLSTTGHQPLGWGPPDGYPDTARAWQSPAAALSIFNSTANIVHGWYPNKLVLPGAKGLLSPAPTTRVAAIDAVAMKVLGRRATVTERNGAATLLAGTKLPATFKPGSWEQQETVALTTLLLLSSPAHLTR